VPNTLRPTIERASLPAIAKISSVHRALPFLAMLILLVTGVVFGGLVGFVLMGIATTFVGWILYLSWPRLTGSERLMRFAVLLLAIVMSVVQLFPQR